MGNTSRLISRTQEVRDAVESRDPHRKTGYTWWQRYAAEDAASFRERSRRPHTMPTRLDGDLAALFLRTRQAHPTWGSRQLLVYLIRRQPRRAERPVASTNGALLKREGLVRAHRHARTPEASDRRSIRATSRPGTSRPMAGSGGTTAG